MHHACTIQANDAHCSQGVSPVTIPWSISRLAAANIDGLCDVLDKQIGSACHVLAKLATTTDPTQELVESCATLLAEVSTLLPFSQDVNSAREVVANVQFANTTSLKTAALQQAQATFLAADAVAIELVDACAACLKHVRGVKFDEGGGMVSSADAVLLKLAKHVAARFPQQDIPATSMVGLVAGSVDIFGSAISKECASVSRLFDDALELKVLFDANSAPDDPGNPPTTINVLQMMRVSQRVQEHLQAAGTRYSTALKGSLEPFTKLAQELLASCGTFCKEHGSTLLATIVRDGADKVERLGQLAGGKDGGESWLEPLGDQERKKWAKVKSHAATTIRVSETASKLDIQCIEVETVHM